VNVADEDEIKDKEDQTFGGESDLEVEDKAPEAHDLGTTEGVDTDAHAPEHHEEQHVVPSTIHIGGSSGSMQSPSSTP